MEKIKKTDPSSVRILTATAIGNVAEFYDYAMFIFLSVILGQHFFPSENPITSMLSVLAVYGGAALIRPFGGIVLGRLADSWGRRPVLVLTFVMMALGSSGIGLLPVYEDIGIAAPILLVLLRLVQAFSAGGEWGVAMAFAVEWAPNGKRALFGSIMQSAVAMGIVLATAINGTMIVILGQESFTDWGWRIPFLLGGLILPVGVYLRRHSAESPAFQAYMEKKKNRDAVSNMRANGGFPVQKFFLFTGIMFCPVAAIPITTKYLPIFAEQFAGLSNSQAMWSTSLSALLIVILTPLMGLVSDKYGRKPLLIASCVLYGVATWPLFHLMIHYGSVWVVFISQVVFALATALTYGPIGAALVEMFGTRERASRLAFFYSVQVAVVAGFSPFIAAWLVEITGNPISVAFFIIPTTVVTLFALRFLPESAFSELR